MLASMMGARACDGWWDYSLLQIDYPLAPYGTNYLYNPDYMMDGVAQIYTGDPCVQVQDCGYCCGGGPFCVDVLCQPMYEYTYVDVWLYDDYWPCGLYVYFDVYVPMGASCYDTQPDPYFFGMNIGTFQLQCNVYSQLLMTFYQGWDSASLYAGMIGYCGPHYYYSWSLPFYIDIWNPWLDPNMPFEVTLADNHYSLAGTWTAQVDVQMWNYCCWMTSDSFTITLLHPCKVTQLSSPEYPPTLNVIWGQPYGGYSQGYYFMPFSDSEAQCYGYSSLCALSYSFTSSLPCLFYMDPIMMYFDFYTRETICKGQTVTVTLTAQATTYPNDTPATPLVFTLVLSDPCTETFVFWWPTLYPRNMFAVAGITTDSQVLDTYPDLDGQADYFGMPGLCGPRYYFSFENYPFLTVTGTTVTLSGTPMIDVGIYSVTLGVGLVNYPSMPGDMHTITVEIQDPCLTTTLTLPTTLVDFTIAAFDGVGFTQSFLPATDSAAVTIGSPSLCGPRVYSILEPQPNNFMTIVSGADEFLNPFNLQALSNSLADMGTHIITLQVTLLNYPGVLPATAVILNAVVQDPCIGAVIDPQTITSPLDYQLVFGQLGPITLTTWMMNTDSAGNALFDPMFCGIKTYTPSANGAWISVLTPADPLSQPYQLQVSTDDYTLAGTYTFDLIVGFSVPIYPSTYTQVGITINLLHPCKVTVITVPTPVLSPINHLYLVNGNTLVPFVDFADTVSAAYGIPTLCALTYTLELAADATAYKVTIVPGAPNQIQIATTDIYKMDTTVTLTLQANATPQQDLASETSIFDVFVESPCAYVTLSFGTLTLADMTNDIFQPAVTQPWTVASDSFSTFRGSPESCGPFTYTIVEGFSFLNIVLQEISLQSNFYSDINVYPATLRASLTNYPLIPPAEITFQVTLTDPCLTTILTLPTTLSTFTIASFDGVGFSQTFMPATDNAANLATVPGLCGPRVYSILEAQPQNFMTIVPPAGDEFTLAWTLNALSNDTLDIGTHTITLQVTLLNYPGVPPATAVILNAVVTHPCIGAVIDPQTITSPLDYQLVFGQLGPITLTTWMMNTDSAGTSQFDPMFCGFKTYTPSANGAWISVLTPADPLSQPYQLQVSTDDYTLAGTYTFDLIVGFADPAFPPTYTQVGITINLLHPCKVTVITVPTPVSTPILHPYVTIGVSWIPITEFADTVSAAYGIPTLCALTYTLEPAADATAYDIVISAGVPNQITINTNNIALKGTSVTLIMSANATPQQDTASETSTFVVEIVDTCPGVTLSFGTLTLTTMVSTVTNIAATQAWTAATDSLSTFTAIADACGPIVYSIIEGHSFLVLDEIGFMLTLQSNNMLEIGVYPATLQATLFNYPAVLPAQILFQVELVDPCLTTILALPTTIIQFTIAAFDGVGFTQTFMPATDSAADNAFVPSLCGPRTYTILELQPSIIVSIVPPSGDPYIDLWTLPAISNSFVDVGLWACTLQVTLDNYPTIAAATTLFTMEVLDPCLGTIIQPFALVDMNVSIYDTTPQVQTLIPAEDSFGILMFDMNICGNKNFVSNDPKVVVTPPTTGLVNTDPWTISCMTNDISLVGVYIVTITASVIPYPTVVVLPITFTLTIIDNCATASLDTQGQVFPPIQFIVMLALGPTLTPFIPFTDDVAVGYTNPSICGPRTYSIVEAYTWATLIPPPPVLPDSDYTDPWTLSVETVDIVDAGTYTLTIDAFLTNYPTATPAQLIATINIVHPCTLTVFDPQLISEMTFYLGAASPTIQQFSQFSDSVANQLLTPNYCGERVYTISSYGFLTLIPPGDPWVELFTIQLSTLDAAHVGIYPVQLSVSLVDYPNVIPLNIDFTATLIQLINKKPYFQTALVGSQTIQMNNAGQSESWTFILPKAVDDDGDTVTVTADLGYAGNFVVLNSPTSIDIDDISEGGSNIREGMYLMNFILFDGKDQVAYPFALFVLAPIPPPVVEELPPEPIVEEVAVEEEVPIEGEALAEELEEEPVEELTEEEQAAAEELAAQEEYLREELGYDFGEDSAATTVSSNSKGKKGETKKSLVAAAFDWQTAFKKLKQQSEEKQKEDATYVPVPPNPYFSSINEQGTIQIGFNSDVFVVPSLQMINNGTIFLDDLQLKDLRELAVTTSQKKSKVKVPVLSVEVIPGLESNVTELAFRWNVTAQSDRSLDIQMYFDNPMAVSQNAIPDKVRVTFNDPNLFIATNGMVMQTQVMEKYLPSQVDSGGSAAQAAAAIEGAASSAKSVVIINFAFNIAMSASLNQLWSMINTQQLIVMMPLFKVILPGNVQAFFNQIFKIASFDIIEIGPYVNNMLNLNATEALNANFDALGFESMFFMNNLGTLLIGFIIYFMSIALQLILDFFIEDNPRIQRFQMKLLDTLYYKSLLSMMMESYAIMSVCVMINLTYIKFGSFGEIVQTVVCFLALAVLLGLPIFILCYLKKAWESGNKEIRHRFEPCFEELDMKKGDKVLWHPFYFLIRRFLMATIVVFFREILIGQVFVKAMSVVYGVILIGSVEALHTPQRRQVEFLNEIIIMMVLYNMICFSPFVPDIQARYNMGFFCCFVVSLHLVVNLAIMGHGTVKKLLFKYRLYRALKRLEIQRNDQIIIMNEYRRKRDHRARGRKKAGQDIFIFAEEGELRENPSELADQNQSPENSPSHNQGLSPKIKQRQQMFGQLTPVREQEEDEVDRIINEVEGYMKLSRNQQIMEDDLDDIETSMNVIGNSTTKLNPRHDDFYRGNIKSQLVPAKRSKQKRIQDGGYDFEFIGEPGLNLNHQNKGSFDFSRNNELEFNFEHKYTNEKRNRAYTDDTQGLSDQASQQLVYSSSVYQHKREATKSPIKHQEPVDKHEKDAQEFWEVYLDDMEKRYGPQDPDLEQLEDKVPSRRISGNQAKKQSYRHQRPNLNYEDDEEEKQVRPIRPPGYGYPYESRFEEKRRTKPGELKSDEDLWRQVEVNQNDRNFIDQLVDNTLNEQARPRRQQRRQ